MQKASAAIADPHHVVAPEPIPEGRRRLGVLILAAGWLVLVATFAIQILHAAGIMTAGFANWRPAVYAYLFWAVA
ncbi:sugar ABC transporter permease, partial [Rhizobiaceae sp. 2RAB30]